MSLCRKNWTIEVIHGVRLHSLHDPTFDSGQLQTHPDQYEAWIHTTPDEAEDFLQLFPAEELTAAPAPRVSSAKPKATPKKKDDAANGSLF